MRALVACLCVMFAHVPAAHAAWGPQGSTILSTLDPIREVEACADGEYGTYVVFNQAGVLRAMHVLPTGDPDPAWPADGLVVCAVNATRTHTAALADGLGGAYVWWMEGLQVFATRITAGAEVAAGWPARGRLIETFLSTHPAPSVVRDAGNGLVLAWARYDLGTIRIARYSPANAVYAGWPVSGVRTVGSAGQDEGYALRWPRVAADDVGGFYLAWGAIALNVADGPSLARLRHIDADGWAVDGWPVPDPSLPLGTVDFATLVAAGPLPASPIAVSDDGRGGAFLAVGTISAPSGDLTPPRVHRREADGSPSPDWPADGAVVLMGGDFSLFLEAGPDADFAVYPSGQDDALIGFPLIYASGYIETVFNRVPSGDFFVASPVLGREVVRTDDGSIVMASAKGMGPLNPYDDPAFLSVRLSGAPAAQLYWESHPEPAITWFGDAGLTDTRDGGLVFFWSQEHERDGLFAIRFSQGGAVTGVTPGPARFALERVRFVRGQGVRAAVSLVDDAPARLELFDLAGRRIASDDVAGSREHTLAGTRGIPSGLYFARLVSRDRAMSAKVLVTR